MALDDTKVMIVSTGAFWYGAVGATKPNSTQVAAYLTDRTMPTGWTDLGHTDNDAPWDSSKDGGDTTTQRSFQVKNLKTSIAPITVSHTINSLQALDGEILKMYYGGGTVSAGEFVKPTTPTAQEHGFVAIMSQGGGVWSAEWFPKVSIIGGDAPIVKTDEFWMYPLVVTELVHSTLGLGSIISTSIAVPA